MALGTAVGGWRIIKTIGSKLVDLSPAHGFAAETAASAVIITATSLKLPISTTHVIAASILGVGATRRGHQVRWSVAVNILLAWVLTIPGAALIGGLAAMALKRF
jgi:PiT family inorganic phosphate transporter